VHGEKKTFGPTILLEFGCLNLVSRVVLSELHTSLMLLLRREFQYQKPCKTLVTRGVSHHGLAIYIKKYFKTKEELWKFKYFTMQKYNLQKNPRKETKILQDIITL